ncbi:hypothetical protein XH80_14685 [Bradyrhizobium sp. CCBAU 45384]|nr:hypothetical protein [Bradyrhizobium sp. CCBAU 45384]
MRAMTPAEASDYLANVLERVCEDVEKLGISCCDADDVFMDFASAIGRELHGPDFRIPIDGSK